MIDQWIWKHPSLITLSHSIGGIVKSQIFWEVMKVHDYQKSMVFQVFDA